ncbi:MAG: DUF1156 domain-containing protein, partial [Phycisphaerae bacterium]
MTNATSHLFPDMPGLTDTAASASSKKTARKSASAAAADNSNLPPNLAQPVPVKVPDFSNPHRPKTCLEVDFPILPINALSALEGNAGKPIYQMSKWWARRRSCIFRALLIAAAMEAPVKKHPDGQPILGPDGHAMADEDAAAAAVWNVYYANHQAAGNFKHLSVLDPFMGGGTTLVEGSRLGFKVSGVDLNPVAWFIVKNELACTDPAEVKAFFDQIEAEVKPQIQPFYVTDGVGGKKGTWFKVAADGSREKMPPDFDPCNLPPEHRKPYQYEGPEIIYTFWAKHGPCIKPGCGHRTPIFRSPVVAIKKLGVKYIPCTCKNKACGLSFHAELGDARIAPDAQHIILENEFPFTVLSAEFTKRLMEYGQGGKTDKEFRIRELSDLVEKEPGLKCPRCGTWSGQSIRDVLTAHRQTTRAADMDKKHLGILPERNGKKPVFCTLLVDPEWLAGSPGVAEDGTELGGYIDAPVAATEKWYRERLKNLRLIEVRGKVGGEEETPAEENLAEGNATETSGESVDEKIWLPPTITLSDGRVIETGKGTVPKRSSFTCGSCGQLADLLESVKDYTNRTRMDQHDATQQRSAPVSIYCLQCYDPQRKTEYHPYEGRYFKVPAVADIERLLAAEREWLARKENDLKDFWPRSELPYTWMTHHLNGGIPNWGYTHWYKFFSPRQLLSHATLIGRTARRGSALSITADEEQAMGAIQQHLRYSCGMAFYQREFDKTIPHFSNNNYHPKILSSEINPFATVGAGRFASCADLVVEGLKWAACPWDRLADAELCSGAAPTGDTARSVGSLAMCGSSTEMNVDWTDSFDSVITDPPFGDNLFYGDLSNFFYVWLRLLLKDRYPEQFGPEFVPRSQEAVADRSRFPNVASDDASAMSAANAAYQGLM